MTTENTEAEVVETPVEVTEAPKAEEKAEQSLAEMADDDAQDATEEEEAGSDDESDTHDVEASADDGDEEEAAPQTVTWVDDEGREWAVPEELTPALMKDKDYRQKTQAVAEGRKALEAREEEFEALQKRTDEDFAIEAEINSLRGTLEQYNKVDWNRLAAEDITEAQQQQFQRGLVKDRLDELTQHKNSRHQARIEEAQRETAKRVSAAESYARENIPGWEQGKGAEIIGFAREIGYDDQSLRKNMGAPFMKMLHRAFVGNQAMNKAKEQPKPQQKQVKPASKVNGQSETTKRVKLADADIATYEAARKNGANPRLIDL